MPFKMKMYVTLDSMLEYSPPALINDSQTSPDSELDKTDDSLENILEEKVNCLSTILVQINHDITKRGDLSQNVINKIYEHYCYLKTKLFELYQWRFGSNRNIESRRSKLEKQLDSLKQEKRQEQVQCFRDILLLGKESRNWFKQYCDLMQRVKIILAGKRP